ncbi:MAG: hypothetical protein KJ064_02415 [Anaerolineae bacterium]|nr:hypothetical protein [Anaerolineae bacterium]
MVENEGTTIPPVTICPECGAAGGTCQDYFHQLLFWEAEYPAFGEVHHLMVLCYHLQHPSLYSPEGLDAARQLLTAFLERGMTPDEVRRKYRSQVDSGQRTWKIKGNPDSHGAYVQPIQWTMTAADVVAGGAASYCENVRAWARSVFEALKAQKQI